jgi:hypothetical protein
MVKKVPYPANEPLLLPGTTQTSQAWLAFFQSLTDQVVSVAGGTAAGLAAEIVARAAADAALQSQITASGGTAAGLAAEIVARAAADAALQSQITTAGGVAVYAVLTDDSRLLFDATGNPIWMN